MTTHPIEFHRKFLAWQACLQTHKIEALRCLAGLPPVENRNKALAESTESSKLDEAFDAPGA